MSDTVSHTAVPKPALPPGIEMQDNEDISWGGLGLLALMALVIFALGIAFSIFVLKDAQNGKMTQQDAPTAPILVGCREDPLKCAQVGIVEQRQIPIEQRARDAKKKGQARLLEYGWSDQGNKQVHIPVAAGMQKVVNGEKP